MDTLHNVRAMRIEPPSRFNAKVPPEIDAIVMTALERDPDRRWQSAAALRGALVDVARDLQTVVTNGQLTQWIEWAFSQRPVTEASELSQLIKILEAPSRPSGRISGPFDRGTPAPQPAQPVKVEPLPSTLPRAPSSNHRVLVIAIVALLLIGAGMFAVGYLGLLH
jgi:serine/threonine protein kinase